MKTFLKNPKNDGIRNEQENPKKIIIKNKQIKRHISVKKNNFWVQRIIFKNPKMRQYQLKEI
jgi:hypothetical protein